MEAKRESGGERRRARIIAPARLHLGFLDLDGGLGRRFGSIGVAIEDIATIVTLTQASTSQITGFERERAAQVLARATDQLGAQGPFALDVERAIPAHAGLGSGTQLGLAIAAAVAALADLSPSVDTLARAVERGARSGIGVGAFATGGFLVDGGRRVGGDTGGPPPIIARLDMPTDWRFLLIFDDAFQGLHGEAERQAFAAPPPFGEARAGRLCRETLTRLLPGVAEGDFPAVSASLGAIQAEVGDYFRFAQGGRFASARVATALDWCAARGFTGIGQTSWGPTGFALVDTASRAQSLAREAEASFPDLRLMTVAPRDRGHELLVTTGDFR